METRLLIDFSDRAEPPRWIAVNDGVMGGVSQGGLRADSGCTATFQGTVSLENSGGFASVRTGPRDFDLAGWSAIRVRVKGDGKRYRFRIRTDDAFDGIAYQQDFTTTAGEWTEHDFRFADFQPSFRGRPVPDAGPLRPDKIRQLGFLIADGQEGPFELRVQWIHALRHPPNPHADP